MVLPVGFSAGRAGSAEEAATEWTWATSQSTAFSSFTEGSDVNLGTLDDGFFWFDGTDKKIRWQPITINESNGSVSFGTSVVMQTNAQSLPQYTKGSASSHWAIMHDVNAKISKVYYRSEVGGTWTQQLSKSHGNNMPASVGHCQAFTNPDDTSQGFVGWGENFRSNSLGKVWIYKNDGSGNVVNTYYTAGFGSDQSSFIGNGLYHAGMDGQEGTNGLSAGIAKLYKVGTSMFEGSSVSTTDNSWSPDTSSSDRFGYTVHGDRWGAINAQNVMLAFNSSDGLIYWYQIDSNGAVPASYGAAAGLSSYKYNHCIQPLNSFGDWHYWRISVRYGSTVRHYLYKANLVSGTRTIAKTITGTTSNKGYISQTSDFYPQYSTISPTFRVWTLGSEIHVATS